MIAELRKLSNSFSKIFIVLELIKIAVKFFYIKFLFLYKKIIKIF